MANDEHRPQTVEPEEGELAPNTVIDLQQFGRRLRALRIMAGYDADIVTVSRRLGHSTVTITDQHYLRPKRNADQRAAEQFDRLITGNEKSEAKAT